MFKNSKSAKVFAGVVGFAMVVAAFGAVVAPVKAQGTDLASLTALIASLQAQIAALTGGSSSSMMTGSAPAAPLTSGSSGASVSQLQSFLISKGFGIPAGATGYFGGQTQSALAAFQAANGISPAVGYYGSVTAAKVASMMTPASNGSSNGSSGSTGSSESLSGGAGDITVTQKNSGTDDTILEGKKNAKVLGMDIDADGSDVSVSSVRVEMKHTGSGSTRLERYVSTVSIMDGNKVIGSADASDFTKNGTTYSKNISVSGFVVKQDATKRLTVALTAVSNIDSNDLVSSSSWEVAAGQIRFSDATGAILTNTDGSGIGGSISNDVAFEDLSSSGDVQLTVEEDDSAVNNAHSIKVSDTSDTNDVKILSFTVKAEGSDMNLLGMSIGVDSTNGGVTEIANDFRLMMGNTEVGTVTIDKDCDGGSDGFASTTDTAICVVVSSLDDDDVVVSSGSDESFTLVADINNVDGGFLNNATLAASLDSSDVDAEDENGDAVTDLSGSADSTNLEFISSGIVVTTVSTPTPTVDTGVSDVATDDKGTYTIVFDVKAIDNAAYVELGSATRGTNESNTGANFVIQDQPNSYAATTTGSIALADLTRVSGGSVSGEFIKINAGSTARFQLSVTFDPGHVTATSVGYRMRLYSVNFAGTAIDATSQQVLTPEVDYRTGAVSIGN